MSWRGPLHRWTAAYSLGRWVLLGWVIALAAVGVRLLILPAGDRSVYPVFRYAGQSWLEQVDLYPQTPQGPGYPLFRYSPPVAAAFVPLAAFPMKVGDLVWRGLNAGALLGGLAWALRRLPGRPLTPRQTAVVFALLLPAVPGGLGNGQCNAMVIGLVLTGYAAATERRFTLAAVVLAISTLLKLYPVAPALLLVALYPRQLGFRYILAVMVGLGLPFLLADSEYAVRQYDLWIRYFVAEDRSGWPAQYTNVDLQLVIRRWIVPLSTPGYRVVEALGGLTFLGLTVAAAHKQTPHDQAARLALGLGCVWMTTLGPATESPTYLILAPVTAMSAVLVWVRRPVDRVGRFLIVIAYLVPLSIQVTLWNAPLFDAYRTLGPQPLAGLFLAAALVWDVWAGRSVAVSTQPRRVPHELASAAAHPVSGEKS
jgi:alpha-1,2-mannosyltransferase